MELLEIEGIDRPLPVPNLVTTLALHVSEAGGRALAIGGCVRDHFLGMDVRDWDVEIHRIEPDALEALLRRIGKVSLVGRSFGVFKLSDAEVELDVSLPRRDSNAGPGHKGIAVQGDPFMGPREAARRRDLTVNAIGIDLRTGALVDPFDGARHLRERTLTMVDEQTFGEDPLRALRAVQFVARLGFTPSSELARLCREAPLEELPAERIEGEWRKLCLKGVHFDDALAFARDTTVLARVFPEASAHPAPSDVLERLAPLTGSLEDGAAYALMLAGWLRCAPAEGVKATCERLRLVRFGGAPLRRWVHALVAHQHDPIGTDADLRWLSTRVPPALLLRLRQAMGDPVAEPALSRAAHLELLWEPPPRLFTGKHAREVGVAPGPTMGRLLEHVYGLQLDGEVADEQQATEVASRWWAAAQTG